MKSPNDRIDRINFKKVFATFFAALGVFIAIYLTFMAVFGEGIALTNFWNRLTLAGFRERLFTDIFVSFRLISYLLLAGFHMILASWVYTDSKKHNCYKKTFPLLTVGTGVIGWLVYMIHRVDTVRERL